MVSGLTLRNAATEQISQALSPQPRYATHFTGPPPGPVAVRASSTARIDGSPRELLRPNSEIRARTALAHDGTCDDFCTI